MNAVFGGIKLEMQVESHFSSLEKLENQKLLHNMEIQASQKLSNLQLELLKLYAMNVSDEELRDIKRLLAKYFMERAMDEADKVWDERGYSNELMEEWRQTKRSELKK